MYALGGTISYSGGYTIHTFTASGVFTTFNPGTVEYLAVGGGGGGGGGYQGGGGGAGGYLASSSQAVTARAYAITVGAGGNGCTNSPDVAATNGGNSVIQDIATAVGGGRGGSELPNATPSTGGSGGGGTWDGSTVQNGAAGTAGPPIQGYAGGNAVVDAPYGANNIGGGGGGGSSGAGSNGVTDVTQAPGGPGTSNSISGGSVTYAAGGKGALRSRGANGANASANTGNGGEAGGNSAGDSTGGNGGSGIVIIRYLTVGEIGKLFGVTLANFTKVMGVSKTTLQKIMGLDISRLPPVSGYVLWVDASGLSTGTGINAATTPVVNLGSQGGSFNSGGYDVVASGIGTKNALKFNGTDQHLLSTNAYSNSGTTLTMFIVQQRISDKGQYSGSLASIQTGDNNDYDLTRNFTHHQLPTTGNMGGQRASADMPGLTHPGNGVSAINTFKFDNVNCTHYQKTSSASTSGFVASTGSFNCQTTVLAARWYNGAVNSRNNIYIGEVLIYNSALSDADRTAVVDYLTAKWGIL